MRILLFAILSAFSALPCLAQTGVVNGQSEIVIIKYDWSKERINWAGDPLSVPNETFNEMRDRVRTERRPKSALEERSNKDAKEDQKKPAKPPRYVFRYLLTVQNNSSKSVQEIDWDYLFSDETTGEVLGRREFTSIEKIGPGRKKQLSILVSSPPTQTISVYSLGSNERAGLVENAAILRILFDDGTVWTRPINPNF